MAENIGPHHMSVAINGAADTIDALVAALEHARRQLIWADNDVYYIDAALALARGSKVDA